MPYIVTTKRPVDAVDCGHPEAPRDGWPVSRHAVATLEEARSAAVNAWYAIESGDRDEHALARRQACLRLPESGGTVGPLPDGTVIEVERESWSAMATDLDIELRWDPPIADGDYLHDRQRDELLAVIAAYNAKQGE